MKAVKNGMAVAAGGRSDPPEAIWSALLFYWFSGEGTKTWKGQSFGENRANDPNGYLITLRKSAALFRYIYIFFSSSRIERNSMSKTLFCFTFEIAQFEER